MHKFSANHRALMERSEFAGCFYCEARFDPEEILEWVDVPADAVPDANGLRRGETAVCPRCGIDSVLPSAAPFKWDDALLSDMHAHWFARPGEA